MAPLYEVARVVYGNGSRIVFTRDSGKGETGSYWSVVESFSFAR